MSDMLGDVASSIGSSIGSAASSLKKSFSYGPHPSVIMWKAADTAKTPEKDTSEESTLSKIGGLIEGARDKVESIFSSASADTSMFNTFKFDAVVSEGHLAESVVTKLPASSGFLVADHIINQNRILKLDVVAANMQNSSAWSISVQGLSVATGAIFNNPLISMAGGLYGAVSSAFETEDRVQSTYALFNSLRTSGTKLYISTILGTYLNCAIIGIRVKQDRNTASILGMELTLEELQVVGSDELVGAATAAIESSYDYSEFAKMAQSLGMGMLGGVSLPGLGSGSPTAQLATLKSKLGNLPNPVSSIKGLLT